MHTHADSSTEGHGGAICVRIWRTWASWYTPCLIHSGSSEHQLGCESEGTTILLGFGLSNAGAQGQPAESPYIIQFEFDSCKHIV